MQLVRFRSWITPAVIGSFVLLSVTGVLMFFHLDSGLNKLVLQARLVRQGIQMGG